MDESPTLASRLRERRKTLQLTQEQLALACGCCTSTVQNIEAGRRLPRVPLLQRIATTLGVKLEDLLPETKEPTG